MIPFLDERYRQRTLFSFLRYTRRYILKKWMVLEYIVFTQNVWQILSRMLLSFCIIFSKEHKSKSLVWLNFENISFDIFSKFTKAFWCYLFLEKGNETSRRHNKKSSLLQKQGRDNPRCHPDLSDCGIKQNCRIISLHFKPCNGSARTARECLRNRSYPARLSA